jgi:hypothetical protein
MRCYCCGEKLGKRFALVTMSDDNDRAFTFAAEHADRVEPGSVVVFVDEAKRRKA